MSSIGTYLPSTYLYSINPYLLRHYLTVVHILLLSTVVLPIYFNYYISKIHTLDSEKYNEWLVYITSFSSLFFSFFF